MLKFKDGDKVRFHSTGDKELDSITGEVIGISHEHITSTFIVLMDTLHSKYPWRACAITEGCLSLDINANNFERAKYEREIL